MPKAQMFSKISSQSQEYTLVHNEFGRTMSRAQVPVSFCNTVSVSFCNTGQKKYVHVS
jgi:hypothetical protein